MRDLMRPDAPQVSAPERHALHVVHGCPSWCVEDHMGEPPEDWAHVGDTWELRLPNGLLVLDATVTLEPGAVLPRLAVGGSGHCALLDDLDVLDADGARQLESALQAFTARVQRTIRVLQGQSARANSGRRVGDSKDARMGWKETRLYLAERDGRQCFYCRTEFDRLKGVSIDHWIPYSVWPCNMPANLVLACQACNERKRDTLPWPIVWTLLAWAREGGTPGEAEEPNSGGWRTAETASLASLAG